ncbi:phosphopantetheine-binding protein [Catenulispora yoronensis]
MAERLATLLLDEQQALLTELVGKEVSTVLGHADSAAAPAPQQPFRDLGFDSLMSVELRNRLSALTGLRLPTTTVFDHPNLGELVTFLRGRLAPATEPDVGAVLGAIDAVTALLTSARLAGVDRVRVTTGLRALLGGWQTGESGAAAAGSDPAALDPTAFDPGDFDGASDQELFDMLDESFGRD